MCAGWKRLCRGKGAQLAAYAAPVRAEFLCKTNLRHHQTRDWQLPGGEKCESNNAADVCLIFHSKCHFHAWQQQQRLWKIFFVILQFPLLNWVLRRRCLSAKGIFILYTQLHSEALKKWISSWLLEILLYTFFGNKVFEIVFWLSFLLIIIINYLNSWLGHCWRDQYVMNWILQESDIHSKRTLLPYIKSCLLLCESCNYLIKRNNLIWACPWSLIDYFLLNFANPKLTLSGRHVFLEQTAGFRHLGQSFRK